VLKIKNLLVPLLLLLPAILLSGCWDVEGLNTRELYTAIAIDGITDGSEGAEGTESAEGTAPGSAATGDTASKERLRVTVQFPLPQNILPPAAGSGSSQGPKFYTVSVNAKSVGEALNAINDQVIGILDNSHVKLVLLHEDIARGGVAQELDFVTRVPKLPKHASLLITRQTGEYILNQPSPKELLPSLDIYQQLQLKNSGNSLAVPVWEFVKKLDEPGQDPYLPILGYNEHNKTFELNGLAVFQHDKLAGVLDTNQTRIISMLDHRRNDSGLEIPLSGGKKVVFRVVKSGKRIIPQDQQGSKFLIKISVHGLISELSFAEPKMTKAEMEQLQEQAASFVKKECQRTLRRIQALRADILLFGLSCRAKYGKDFSFAGWQERYSQANIDVEVDFHIDRAGAYF